MSSESWPSNYGDRHMPFWKKAALVALVTGGVLLTGKIIDYDMHNCTDIGFRKGSWGILGDVGNDNLNINQGELFGINYLCIDKDSVKEMILYRNCQEIARDSLEGGVFGTRFENSILAPGKYNYRLVTIDSKGNQREDIGKVVVSTDSAR